MKELKIIRENEVYGKHSGEWGVFELSGFTLWGNDYSDNAVILLNGAGNFIVGKKHKNCIAIGRGDFALAPNEYKTFAEAEQYIWENAEDLANPLTNLK